jgi:apolipoprotein N-acyltransferase
MSLPFQRIEGVNSPALGGRGNPAARCAVDSRAFGGHRVRAHPAPCRRAAGFAVPPEPRTPRALSAPAAPPASAPLGRAAWIGAAMTLQWLASPGALAAGGSTGLALAALAAWGIGARRPGRHAFLVEWLLGGLGVVALVWWVGYVLPAALVPIGLVCGAYFALGGWLLRRLGRWPLALSLPAAWCAAETMRVALPEPLGFGWLQVAHSTLDAPWAGSARLWGAVGLSWTAAAMAGLVLDLALSSSRARAALSAGLAPLAIAWAAAGATSPPECVAGPRVLLVQPGFEQERKQALKSASEFLRDQVELTRRAVSECQASGAPPPDLVCWGETMLPMDLAGEGLWEAVAGGAAPDPWRAHEAWTPADVRAAARAEDELVAGVFFGRDTAPALVPPGASFAAGAEVWEPLDGRLRRFNALALWDARGARAGYAKKLRLVPGGETMHGAERFRWVRDLALELAGYVPDLAAGEEVGVLELADRDGRAFRCSGSVCFDNAGLAPYTAAVRARDGRGAGVDFHLVVSNEAWYRESPEADHMLAFSRLAAIATARSFVRATNSGISAVLGPDGSELARVHGGTRDRMVAGWTAAYVPVPAAARRGALVPPTPYAASERLWLALALVAGPALAVAGIAGARRGRTAAS